MQDRKPKKAFEARNADPFQRSVNILYSRAGGDSLPGAGLLCHDCGSSLRR